jgi:hypothetical protein
VNQQDTTRHSVLMRAVNDRIFELLSEFGSEDGEFLCECSNADCIETIQFMLREYAALRAQPERPLRLSGHPEQ